ncbi:MAG TPA: tetratricopeptide repeat protein [Polyangia bacterium]|nr:tetratricopeptide repeat protein [Polyangia bacterium]
MEEPAATAVISTADTAGPPDDDHAAALALVNDLLAELERESAPAARAAQLCRIAEVYERRLGDAQNALITLQAAFREQPTSGQVVHEMERLARLFEKWREVVTSTAEVAAELSDPKPAADLWTQIAFWCDVGLRSTDEAIAAGQRALALVPRHGGALALLEALYRRTIDFDRLADVLDRMWADPLRDPNRVAEGYAEILRAQPRHLPSLMGLSRVSEALGDWPNVLALLGRAAECMAGADRVSLHFRLGEVALAQAGDPAAAEAQYAQALALDAGHVPSMLALLPIYRERGDWLKTAQLLARAGERQASADKKVELLFEAATIHREKLDDEDQASALYAQILAVRPLHAAALPLLDIYFKRRAWAALRPLAEALADGGSADGPARGATWLATVCHRLARAAEGMGDHAAAVAAYRRSLAADPGFLPTLRDWGALAFSLQDWEQATQLYDSLIFPRREQPSREEMFEALHRLGVCRSRLGQDDKAADFFARALALDPQHRPSLEALAEIHERAADWDAVIADLRALLALPGDAATRVALHERLSDVFHDRKTDPERAIAECEAALDAAPDAPRVLHRLLELLTETRQWRRALPILAKLAEGAEGKVRARYLVAAANIQNYELGAADEAVELYNRALDEDPDDLKTFERIDKLVIATEDWKNQARCYRWQIKRMGPATDANRAALLALWQGLGEISRARLGDYAAAAAAFEVCVGLDPDDLSRHAVLAEMHQLCGPEQYAQAIEERRLLVRKAVGLLDMVPHLKMLVRLHAERSELDALWCVTQALSYLGQADAEEQRVFVQYRPQGFVRPRSRLTEDLWQKHLYHRDQDRVASQVLGTVAHTVMLARAKPHKDWGLRRKRHRDVAHDPSLFCKVLAFASQMLGVPWPEVHMVSDAGGEIGFANVTADGVAAPAFIVGREVLQGRHEMEIAFIAGRGLALARADHLTLWPAVVQNAAERETVLLAAIALVRDGHPVPAALAGSVLRYRDFLGRALSPAQVEQLDMVVKRAGINQETTFDLPRWAEAAQLTAARAGLIIANDLRLAVQLGTSAAAGRVIDSPIDPARIERDLVEWSVSKDYLALRAHLGFTD